MTAQSHSLPDSVADSLLSLARKSIETGMDDVSLPRPEPMHPAMVVPSGAFVTLKLRGMLRGCIGRIEAEWPLWETVARMARAAAFEDPRFASLTREELAEVEIEVSVMTPLTPVASATDVVAGEHGVLIQRGENRAVFLPQVATEQGWDRDMLLTQLSLKAGLPADAWRGDDVSFSVFTAVVFDE